MNSKAAVTCIAVLVSTPATSADLTGFPPTNAPYGWVGPVAVGQADVSDGNAKLYRGWFDNVTLSGDLVQQSISTSGAVSSSTAWSAATMLDARSFGNRMVIRGNDTSYNLCTSGNALESFFCGDNSNELSADGSDTYRDRVSDLGTVIHSHPVLVGKPRFAYNFDDYLSFRSTHLNRAQRLYAGANDGMLHVFDTSGNEIFGYMPGITYAKATSWATDTTGAHQYLVDGPLVTGDAYADFDGDSSSEWASLLVGGLGAGGQGYFALDVTAPVVSGAGVSTVAAAKRWEFAPTGIGYTYGAPVIARTNADDKWALIAGNGYVQGGEPILYVRDIQAPDSVIQDFDNLETPQAAPQGNGLSAPAAIDIDGDYKVDYAYAGDLNGNLWRFDLKDSQPANWNATKIFSATDGTHAQPILSAPELGRLSSDEVMVYFGTGDPWGISSAATHSVYALKDKLSSTTSHTRSELKQRTTSATSNSLYLTVNETVSPNDTAVDWSAQQGWYLDLASDAHLLQSPILNDNRTQFVVHDLEAGNNWLIQLEYMDGRLPEEIVFDINGDGVLTADGDNIDYVDSTDQGDLVIGLKITADLISRQTLAMNGEATLSYLNTWQLGTTGSEGTTTNTYDDTACSTMTFSRIRVEEDNADVTFNYTAHTVDGDYTASITVDPDVKDDNARSPGPGNYPASAGAGSGINTTTGEVQKWFGLELKVLADTVGSNDTRLVVTYHGPYRTDGFTLASSSKIYRLDDSDSYAIRTCEWSGYDYAAKACTGTSSCNTRTSRFDYSTSKASVTYTGTSWSDLNASSSYDPKTTQTTEGTAGTAASGSTDGELQSGADGATGRLRWRELIFGD